MILDEVEKPHMLCRDTERISIIPKPIREIQLGTHSLPDIW